MVVYFVEDDRVTDESYTLWDARRVPNILAIDQQFAPELDNAQAAWHAHIINGSMLTASLCRKLLAK